MDEGNSREIRSFAQGSSPQDRCRARGHAGAQASVSSVTPCLLPVSGSWAFGLLTPPPCPLHAPFCLSVCLCVCRSLCSACPRPPSLLSGAAAAAPAGSHGALWTRTDCTLSVVTHSFLRDQALLPSLAGSLAVFPPVTSSSGPAGIGCVLSQLSSFLILFLLSGAFWAPACILHSFLSFRPLFKISCSQTLPWFCPVLSSLDSTCPALQKGSVGRPCQGPVPCTSIRTVFLFCFSCFLLACEVLRVASVLIWCYLQPAHHWCSVNTH